MRDSRFLIPALLLITACGAIPPDHPATSQPQYATLENGPKTPTASSAPSPNQVPSSPPTLDLTQYVDPFIGTGAVRSPAGKGGNTFPGASAPFGMVQWSPDTVDQLSSRDPEVAGYSYDGQQIVGFSLTHFSGSGCPNNMDFPIMPTLAPLPISPGRGQGRAWLNYGSEFSHVNESASPGYYRVRLDKTDVEVELTATSRTGFARFTFPPSSQATILISTGYRTMRPQDASVRIEGNDQVIGSVFAGDFCFLGNRHRTYFAAKFDRPFDGFGSWQLDKLLPNSRNSSGDFTSMPGAYLTFDTTHNPIIRMKVALSYVSAANALDNLNRENPGWDFDLVKSQVKASWNDLLGRIQIEGGAASEKKVFYTALYHALLHPNVLSDVNGEYPGFDTQVHKAEGYLHYSNFSGWDIYRCWAQLAAILAPQQTIDMIKSLVADAEEGGGGLPKWPYANTETGVMIGDPGALVVANAYAFGARDFDTGAALEAMDRGASQPGSGSWGIQTRPGLAEYVRYGYVPSVPTEDTPNVGGIWGSAATTLEYATADFAIAQFAQTVGKTDRYRFYLPRARNWQNLFDPGSGYIRPREPDGSWEAGFDPTQTRGFVEGNAIQYTWMIPYDLPALIDKLGGSANVLNRLDRFFAELNGGALSPYSNLGNEPGFGTPWIYDFAGAPWKTQQVVRRITNELFAPTPGGLPGNDDLGAMSAWYVWAALGLYPEIPGTDVLVIGSPLFPRTRVQLTGGKELQVVAANAAIDAPYVQSLRLNGQESTHPWLRFRDIVNGAMLEFTLGTNANTAWGSAPADAPPSFMDSSPTAVP